jgi:predicted nucleotidyltransferase
MWLLHPLEKLFSSPAKVAVLRVICSANSPLSGRETIRRAGVTYSPGWNALQDLVASGVLSKRDHGRASAYELRDPEEALLQSIRALFAAEDERSAAIISGLASQLDEALSIILYGSEARGDAEAASDTDLLIIVQDRTAAIEEHIDRSCLGIAGDYSLALSWHIADLADLREWEETDSEFWRNILRDGIRLSGETIERLRSRWQTGRGS